MCLAGNYGKKLGSCIGILEVLRYGVGLEVVGEADENNYSASVLEGRVKCMSHSSCSFCI